MIKKINNTSGKIGLAIEHDAAKKAWLDEIMVVRETLARKACVLRECVNSVMILTSEETIIHREEIQKNELELLLPNPPDESVTTLN